MTDLNIENLVVIDLGCSKLQFSNWVKLNRQPEFKYLGFDANKSFSNCYNLAVSDKSGKINYYVTDNYEANNTLNLTINVWTPKSHEEVFCIDTGSVILLNSQNKEYIIMKIDIEGSEFHILENLISTDIINFVKEIYIEWHDHANPDFPKRKDFIIAELNKRNIKIHNWY